MFGFHMHTNSSWPSYWSNVLRLSPSLTGPYKQLPDLSQHQPFRLPETRYRQDQHMQTTESTSRPSKFRFLCLWFEIRDIIKPTPTVQTSILEPLHPSCFTNRDYKLSDSFDFLFRSSVVQCANKMTLQLGVDILRYQAGKYDCQLVSTTFLPCDSFLN